MGLPFPCLMLVTAPCDGLVSAVAQAVEGGVNVVLWHDTRTKIGKRDPVLTGLVAATAERAVLVASGDWETYVRHGIRRIHLPERSVPVGVVKFRIGNGALVGKSVGSAEAAAQAAGAGADYVIAGSLSPGRDEGATGGPDLAQIQAVCAATRLSVVAGGGVTPENTADCIAAGAVGVAAATQIVQASDPNAAARRYRAALDAAWASRTSGEQRAR